MSIPDQSHINHIRELLWNTYNGGASVMIGAGFSLNAIPTSASAKKFPLWSQVAKNLCSRLYPPSEKNRLEQALTEASGTSGFLRLAQEYEIAFGRGSLHNFIQDSVPDLEYQPSELHYQLLELPWKEVLTTNWDTLLERAQFEIPERNYSIVRTVEELASTPSPRIIKLHGTVPSHIPFIFTEEDYRTYPRKFAPFVNTVQQIMMESTVLLIGFSGDDPNFLQWSGWVRDNLGETAPKIYLAGWLGLSPHRRRMLENNNVVAIDIANHPKANEWPEHLRHHYATEWIIKTLQCGQSYKSKDWPSPNTHKTPVIADYLQPVEQNTQMLPKSDSRFNFPKNITIDDLKKILSIWEHNRNLYPNWLVLPIDKFFDTYSDLNRWIEEFILLFDKLKDIEKLNFFTEVIWFYQKNLVPIPTNIRKKWEIFSSQINFEEKSINNFSYIDQWGKIKNCYIENTLYVITTSRLLLDNMSFENNLLKIERFSNYSNEIKNRIIYEKCQWNLLNLDFSKLEKILESWNIYNADPIWMFRKASLLLELNQENSAKNLIIKGFSILKKNPDRFNDYTNSSREGWALLSILALEVNNQIESDQYKIKSFNIFERQEQLALINCNTNNYLDQLMDRLSKRNDKIRKSPNPNFDLYRSKGETIYSSHSKNLAIDNVFKCLLLGEIAGLPLKIKYMSVGDKLLKSVAQNYDLIDINLAMRILPRLKPIESDELINNIYSRINIARLHKDDLLKLIEQISNLLNYCINKSSHSHQSDWIYYVNSCLEILSRLIIRLQNEEVEQQINQVILLLQNESLRNNFHLTRSLFNYLKRCWEVCSNEMKSKKILDILGLPIYKVDDSFNIPELFISDEEIKTLIKRRPEDQLQWNHIINIIISGLKLSKNPRWEACLRYLIISDFLTESEKNNISNNLWHGETIEYTDFPSDTNLYDGEYIRSSLIDEKLAIKIFKQKHFKAFDNFEELSISLNEIAGIINKITLTPEEEIILISNISIWLDKIPLNKIESNNFLSRYYTLKEEIISTFIDIKEIFIQVNLTNDLAEKIYKKLKKLDESDIYCYQLVGLLIPKLKSKEHELYTFIRKGIISDNEEKASYAMYGLYIWIEITMGQSVTSIELPPEDLIKEIGLTISTRRKSNLIPALLAANTLVKELDLLYLILKPILEGLEYLLLETDYNLTHENPEKVSIIRLNCFKLAYNLLNREISKSTIVEKWIHEGENDPLPEVRNAIY